jgi:hypothetical protein
LRRRPSVIGRWSGGGPMRHALLPAGLIALLLLPAVTFTAYAQATEPAQPTRAGGPDQVPGKTQCLTEAQLQPPGTKVSRFTGKDARIFFEALQPGTDPKFFDTLVVFSGARGFGGGVAFAFKDGCSSRPKFFTDLEYIYATQMVTLFSSNDALKDSMDMDLVKLKALAQGGNAAAQFHQGYIREGLDRRAAIEWLKRGAGANFSPAMLALGMELSGAEWPATGPLVAGQSSTPDEFTDLALAYYWLTVAAECEEESTRHSAEFHLSAVMKHISPEERIRGKGLILAREPGPQVPIEETATLLGQSFVTVLAAPDVKSLQVLDEETARFSHAPLVLDRKLSDAEAVRLIAEYEAKERALEDSFAELQRAGRMIPLPAGTIVHILGAESDWTEVEPLMGEWKGKVLYVKTRDVIK